MNFEVSFRNIRPREEIKQRATVLCKKLHKFLDASSEATLLVDVEHSAAVLELVVSSRGETHKVVEEHGDLRTALDKTFHTMEKQLRRSKERRLAGRRDVPDEDGFEASP